MSPRPLARPQLYLVTWLSLLALTVVMLVLDSSPVPRLALLAVLLGAMLGKAGLIGGHFMHLRFEPRILAWCALIGLLVVGAVLFGLIAPDGLRILHMVER